jgi:hypothetical protein
MITEELQASSKELTDSVDLKVPEWFNEEETVAYIIQKHIRYLKDGERVLINLPDRFLVTFIESKLSKLELHGYVIKPFVRGNTLDIQK